MNIPFEQGLALFSARASLEDLKAAAAFSRVVPGTVLGWVTDGAPPKGEAQIRMMYYLQLRGVDLEELLSLPQPAFDLGLSIAVGAIEVEEAVRELGYANTQDLYRLLRGAELPSTRAERLTTLLGSFRDTTKERLHEAALEPLEITSSSVSIPPQVEPSVFESPAQLIPPQSAPSGTFAAEHTAGALLTATALVESHILAGGDDLEIVKRLIGGERLLELASHLERVALG